MVKFNSEFYATYKMFAEYLSYSGPVIFNEWDMLDDDKKQHGCMFNILTKCCLHG